MALDRRHFTLSTLASTFALTAPRLAFSQASNDAYFAQLHEAAKKEGEVNWYIAYLRVDLAERVSAAFQARYPGVRCNVVRATGQVIYQRLSQDMKAGAANCDVFSSSDLGHYVTLKAGKNLLPFKPRNLADCTPLIQGYDPDDMFTITDGNTTVMSYNSNLVKAEDAPKSWKDFIDPKWKDQVAVAHPGYSGAMGGWVMSINNLYGWDYFEKLKANRPQIGRSLTDPVATVQSGERKIGIGSGASVFSFAQKSSIRGVYPEDGTIVSFSPSGIIANSKRPNAAKLFIEFMLSKEAATMTSQDYTVPVRNDVEPQPGINAFGQLKNGITKKAEELNEKVPALIEKWRDTFGV